MKNKEIVVIETSARSMRTHSNEFEEDPRWQLTERVLRSTTMRRAVQLRNMLAYIVQFHLSHPNDQLREQDIALGVLGRRDDFDPAYDNIVRVQASHLRKKLTEYFDTEGRDEPMTVSLPKGGYHPTFEPRLVIEPEQVVVAPQIVIPFEVKEESSKPYGSTPGTRWARFNVLLGAGFLGVALVAGFLYFKGRTNPAPTDPTAVAQIFSAVGHRGDRVALILPDTSLLMLQKLVNTEISVEQYSSSSFLQNLADQTNDPQLRHALSFVGSVRATTLNEAQVGMEFVQTLREIGMDVDLRYARDMHIRDLGAGNFIFIGNPRSDPWISLFANRSNFIFVQGSKPEEFVFRNQHPTQREQNVYVPEDSSGGFANYVDITLTTNLTGNGYVLIVNGSDVPANEAAARFLLQGHLPTEISTELRKGKFRTFEIFLRGHHRHGESNDALEIVTYRVQRN